MPSEPAVSLPERLAPFRRRLVMATFLRLIPVTSAIALGLVAVMIAATGAASGAGVAMAAIGVAAGVALGIALWRTPSLEQTARTVDRHFGLHDCIATGLQFAAAADAAARLTAATAGAQLAVRRPSQLPLHASAPWSWAGLGGAIAALLFVITVTAREPGQAAVAGSRPPTIARGAAAASTDRPSANRQSTTIDQEPSPAAAVPDAAGPARPELSPSRAGTPGPVDARRDDTRLAAAPDEASASGDARSEAREDGAGLPGRASLTAAGSGSPSTREARSAAAPGGAGGRGAGALVPSALLPAAGGVTGGTLVDAEGRSPGTRRTAGVAEVDGDLAVSARGAASTADQRVPRRLRGYVRDYFLAIRPRTTP